MCAAEHIHQRALAGPVLPDQRVDFAGLDAQGNTVERPGCSERLGDVHHLQARGYSRSRQGLAGSRPAASRARFMPAVLVLLEQKTPSNCPR